MGSRESIRSISLNVPFRIGRVTWIHGITVNTIRLSLERYDAANPGHHHPATGSNSTDMLSNGTMNHHHEAVYRALAPVLPAGGGRAHGSPGESSDSGLESQSDTESEYESDTDTDLASQVAAYGANTASRSDGISMSALSAHTPSSVATSVFSGHNNNINHHHPGDDNNDDQVTTAQADRGTDCSFSTGGAGAGMGAWLPTQLELATADVPRNPTEVIMADLREDPSGASLEEVMGLVGRYRDEIYRERFQRASIKPGYVEAL